MPCPAPSSSSLPSRSRMSVAPIMLMVAAFVITAFIAGCTDADRTDTSAHHGALAGKRVAILATHGFEQSELLEPREALADAGATVVVIAPEGGSIRAWKTDDWGRSVSVDQVLSRVKPADFDALLLPGGVINPDKLRVVPEAIAFIKSFVDAGKPIAAICHGPWPLIDAGGVKGKKLTSWPSLKADLTNAGANWVDAPVVRDGNLVTSRKPDDLPAFNAAMLDLFAGGSSVRR